MKEMEREEKLKVEKKKEHQQKTNEEILKANKNAMMVIQQRK